MGSEGTLGIITKATLKLLPLAPYRLDILAVFTEVQKAVDLVPALVKAGLNPTSVEFMDNGLYVLPAIMQNSVCRITRMAATLSLPWKPLTRTSWI